MLKQFLINLTASLAVVCGFFAGIAFLLSQIMPFWLTFISISVIVWILTMVVKSAIQHRKDIIELDILSKINYEDERNTVLVTCPCQQNTFPMQVYPTVENEYVCDVCKNKFSVNVTIEPILQTNPINLDNAYKIFETLKQQDIQNP